MRQAFCDCGRPILAWTKYRRKVIRPKGDHDLCQKCWKAQRDRTRLVTAVPVIPRERAMGERELKTQIVRERALRLKEFDDANPDVGMPPMWWMHVEDAMKALGYTQADVDYESLVGKDVAEHLSRHRVSP